MVNAKIFVSCGQRSDDELRVLMDIRARLRALDLDPYIAIWDNTLAGLKENIFRELQDSEYFLFIDFRRETLGHGTHRGSLFCHQELAIASFLELPAVGFREADVLERDGLMPAIQLNCLEFNDRNQLATLIASVIEQKIQNGQWNPHWKAQLSMERAPNQRGGSVDDPPFIFHIKVMNQHWRKTAYGCRAFLSNVKHNATGVEFKTRSFELKWTGTKVPDVTITQGRSRSFDAFEIDPETPTRLKCSMSHADTEKVWSSITEPGEYELTLIVTSQNF